MFAFFALALGVLGKHEPPADIRIIKIMAPRCAEKTGPTDEVTVHYSGWLKENYPEGAMFDSSKKREKPFTFQLGKKKVIRGWEESLQDMCPGEKRLLEIPPHYAYGSKGAGKLIPPDSTLVFEVELLSMKKMEAEL
jgi:FKBP-type peptidyl-prolyl cis-trans isomerase